MSASPMPDGRAPKPRRDSRKHIVQVEKLHRQRNDTRPRLQPRYHGQGEAEVVLGFQLSQCIETWLREWRSERPLGNFGADQYGPGSKKNEYNALSGPEALSQQSGIHVRQISRIQKNVDKFVSLTHADKLLSAMGMGYKLVTGEVQVVPNPNWSPERWIEYMQERGC